MVTVKVRVNITKAERKLLSLESRFKNLEKLALGPIRALVTRTVQKHWASRGAAFGKPWKPLAASTIERKRRMGTLGLGPLKSTKALFLSLINPRTGTRLRRIANGVMLDVFSNDPKAAWHHKGVPGRLPKRQVFPSPPPPQFVTELRSIVRTFIATGRVPA